MEANYQIQLLKDLASDIESSTNDLKAANARYRELIVDILPFILRHKFNVGIDRIPSNLYLKELCAMVEDESKFTDLQELRRYYDR